MKIHDHFEGSSHCVQCGGYCCLEGDDLAVTNLLRSLFETAEYREVPIQLNFIGREAISKLGVDFNLFARRAAVARRMKKQAIADLPAIQRRDREALELADREGITFAEAWARLARVEQYPGGLDQPNSPKARC